MMHEESTMPATAEQQPRPIVMVGNAASGKSAVGRATAGELKWPFVDSDQVIVAPVRGNHRHFRHRGRSAVPPLRGRGDPRDHRRASRALRALSRWWRHHGSGDPRTARGLTVIWLDVDLATVLPRLTGRTDRPIMNGNVAETWTARDQERRPVFEQLADIRIDARGATAARAVAREIARRIPTRTA